MTDDVVTITYTEAGVTRTYRRPASEQWAILARADAKFCNASERADEPLRYQRAIEWQRRAGDRK